MKVDEIQVGGTHYKVEGLQHWGLVDLYRVGYFEANISKYVTRWRKKNGVQDLEKAAHYLQKLIELRSELSWSDCLERQPRVFHDVITRFVDDNQLIAEEAAILHQVLAWRSIQDLVEAAKKLQSLIECASGGPTAGYVNQDR